MHATAVTASRSIPAAAGQLSMRTMASCYNCRMHSLPGHIVPFVEVLLTEVTLPVTHTHVIGYIPVKCERFTFSMPHLESVT